MMTADAAGRATRESWKALPPPDEKEYLGLTRTFTVAEMQRIAAGLIPRQMEDKWFVFFEEPWLYLHRSWTGFCTYAVRLEPTPMGTTVVESWVSRNPEQHRGSTTDYERALLTFLIDALLLGKRVSFPVPPDVPPAAPPGIDHQPHDYPSSSLWSRILKFVRRS